MLAPQGETALHLGDSGNRSLAGRFGWAYAKRVSGEEIAVRKSASTGGLASSEEFQPSYNFQVQ